MSLNSGIDFINSCLKNFNRFMKLGKVFQKKKKKKIYYLLLSKFGEID